MLYKDKISEVYKPLSKEEQFLHIRNYRENGDKKSRDVLITSCLPLVVKIAEKFSSNNKHIDFDDFVQEGNMALVNCVEKFDEEQNVSITTLAYYAIQNSLINMIHKSQYKIKNALSLTGYASKMISKINSVDSDDVNVISAETGLSKKMVKKMISGRVSNRKSMSSNRVRKVMAKEEETEKPPCLADLKSLIDQNVESPNKEIFMEFHGISTKKKKMAELSIKYNMPIKDITSILNRTKTALSKVAKEIVSA